MVIAQVTFAEAAALLRTNTAYVRHLVAAGQLELTGPAVQRLREEWSTRHSDALSVWEAGVEAGLYGLADC